MLRDFINRRLLLEDGKHLPVCQFLVELATKGEDGMPMQTVTAEKIWKLLEPQRYPVPTIIPAYCLSNSVTQQAIEVKGAKNLTNEINGEVKEVMHWEKQIADDDRKSFSSCTGEKKMRKCTGKF